ncbi:histidine--tRNA ligase [Aeropyrum camini]|uniref:Histidine--tRNA ligase n=1 Tax=Aeropyrum camini SY1 = JCM 12091 TaxID=1198449 RepID=U3TD54_9CREN|nr:histidine--tRNA ligase [Aeropyrum camini]BAN89960.1 histidyl-tRNA synthetase [Aeropyrum camini SY1 = JCM 12091]
MAGGRPRPPRGFRDFPPEVMILRKRLLSRLERVFESYGFDPLDTPAVEYWETLSGKYGEEAEARLIWRFQDPWSGRWYALRYDLTVPLARFVASNPGLQMPFKRYHIGKVWRHEEPQKGRYREFVQCDADIVGSPHPEADAEVVSLVVDSMEALGFNGFRVRVNDRRLLAGIFEEELSLENPLPIYRAIDKLDKIGEEGVRRELEKLGLAGSTVARIMEIISWRGRPGEVLESAGRVYGSNRRVREALDHLEEMLSLARDSRVELDLSLVRGLDYYTGPILEVVLDEPRIGSVAGGGRYDGLIGMFAGRDIPATGVSIGIERIIDAGLELGVYSLDVKTVAQVAVVVLDRSYYSYAWEAARLLRKGGFNVRIDLSRASGQVQRRKASRLGIPVVAFVGGKEAEGGFLTLYSAATGERVMVPLIEAAKAVERLLPR